MSDSAKKRSFTVAAWVLILLAVYSLLGILQALSLFQGERVLVNLRLWGSIMLFAFVGAIICLVIAARFRRRLAKCAAVRQNA